MFFVFSQTISTITIFNLKFIMKFNNTSIYTYIQQSSHSVEYILSGICVSWVLITICSFTHHKYIEIYAKIFMNKIDNTSLRSDNVNTNLSDELRERIGHPFTRPQSASAAAAVGGVGLVDSAFTGQRRFPAQ